MDNELRWGGVVRHLCYIIPTHDPSYPFAMWKVRGTTEEIIENLWLKRRPHVVS